MKIAIIGRTEMLYNTAKHFIKNNHEIVLVITSKESPEYKVTAEDFKILAKECGAKFIYGNKLHEHSDTIRMCGAQIGISMNWPNILDSNAISLFPLGILNAHPGDLPKYRGNACPNWAIINMESEIVLTIHKMQPGELDSGDIVMKHSIPLDSKMTIGDVYNSLNDIMPQLYLSAVDGLTSGILHPIPQSKSSEDILRVYPRLPQDSFIDWNKPAAEISTLIRASSEPFQGAYTYFNNEKLFILDAVNGRYSVPCQSISGQIVFIDRVSGAVHVAADNSFVIVKRVRYNEHEYVRPCELMKSMRIRLGMMVEDEIAKLRKELDILKTDMLELKGCSEMTQ